MDGTHVTGHAENMQEDFPAIGTSLNPVHDLWMFSNPQTTARDGQNEQTE